jgi:ADP-dependent NAD(P)H-hydrate dehydratase / NAD(P)H-hydrate epimerase
MHHILTIEEMRHSDAAAINEYSIPGAVLMENASRSAAEYIINIVEDNKLEIFNIDIICGSGNNGGDGFALARHLHESFNIRIFWIGSEDKMSPETKNNFLAAQKCKIPTFQIKGVNDLNKIEFSTECIIDSMIGVGGSENIKGIALDILKKLKKSNALKIAIDAPTGLNTETGFISDFCFDSDFTVTMFAVKKGMLLNPGPDVCGDIYIAYLGAPEEIIIKNSRIAVLEDSDISGFLPERKRVSSKFDYGRIMLIAGSKKYPGAACLSANSAIIGGAGLVHLYSTYFHSSVLPEIIPVMLQQTNSGAIAKEAYEIIMSDIDKFDILSIGPGLSDDKETISFVKKLIKDIPEDKTVVIDADGLRAIDKTSKLRKNIILTPHTGELSRITGIARTEIEKDSFDFALKWSKKLNCTLVLKHIPVIITDGDYTYLNINGNSGLATGGSGDVLTGLISAFAAQGLDPLRASSLACYIHAKAGDNFIDKYSELTLTASGIINEIPGALKI